MWPQKTDCSAQEKTDYLQHVTISSLNIFAHKDVQMHHFHTCGDCKHVKSIQTVTYIIGTRKRNKMTPCSLLHQKVKSIRMGRQCSKVMTRDCSTPMHYLLHYLPSIYLALNSWMFLENTYKVQWNTSCSIILVIPLKSKLNIQVLLQRYRTILQNRSFIMRNAALHLLTNPI